MTVGLDLVVRTPTDDVSDAREKLNQDGNRISLGVWLNRPHHVPRQPVIGRLIHHRPWPLPMLQRTTAREFASRLGDCRMREDLCISHVAIPRLRSQRSRSAKAK